MIRAALILALLSGPASAETVYGWAISRDVVVHFVGPLEFARHCPPRSRACSYPENPCQVYIPGPVGLWGDARTQFAGFDDPMVIAELAHETLHCTNGAWHQTR